MRNNSNVYRGSASADDVRDAVTDLFRDFESAAHVMPAAWIASAISDLAAATAFDNAGRRGDAMRRFMSDLHAELADADERLQRCQPAAVRPPLLAAVG